MTAIWAKSEGTWSTLSTAGFPDEAALHALVEEAPQLLPLAGSPSLVVVGREVQLGSGRADLIAIEPGGRPAIIEVKLAGNPEARRAVIAQVLAYAAYLRGLGTATLEAEVLGVHLKQRGFGTLADAVKAADQAGAFDEAAFHEGLRAALETGAFRLVLVLDAIPAELSRLVAYLVSMAPGLVIDLVTVTAYRIGETQVMVPQRIEPGQSHPATASGSSAAAASVSTYYEQDAGDEFRKAMTALEPAKQDALAPLVAWAQGLEADGLVRLFSFVGKKHTTLLPRLLDVESGPFTIAFPGVVWGFRSVLEKRAPKTLAALDARLSAPIGKGTVVQPLDADVLALMREAFIEAKGPAGQG